jgi:hypothetical protein
MAFENMGRTVPGRRRRFLVCILNPCGSYPDFRFETPDTLYVASESLVYSVVESHPPNEFGWSEIAWNTIGDIWLWGALALSIREGEGFYAFVPDFEETRAATKALIVSEIDGAAIERAVARMVACTSRRQYTLHWVKPQSSEVEQLYVALRAAQPRVLRGVNCFLKALMLWSLPSKRLLDEEMGFNLYIALEGGLAEIRQRLTAAAGRSISYMDTLEFVAGEFTHGEALAQYWYEAHGDRNELMHPDNPDSPYAIHPISADDIWELFDPMLTLYRYIMLGEKRPTFDASGQPHPRKPSWLRPSLARRDVISTGSSAWRR